MSDEILNYERHRKLVLCMRVHFDVSHKRENYAF